MRAQLRIFIMSLWLLSCHSEDIACLQWNVSKVVLNTSCFFCCYGSPYKNPELGSHFYITLMFSTWKINSHKINPSHTKKILSWLLLLLIFYSPTFLHSFFYEDLILENGDKCSAQNLKKSHLVIHSWVNT